MSLKYLLHVPVEQYGFVESEVEADNLEEAKEAYKSISRAWQGAEGLDSREFQQFIVNMLLGQSNHIEQVEQMNDIQRIVINECKKALKTIKRNNV